MLTTLDTTIETNLATTNLFYSNERIITRLNFINRTDQEKIPPVVVFQKNMLLAFDQTSIAWKVIKNCGQGDYYTFHFSPDYYMDASDSNGTYSCKIPIRNGQIYELSEQKSMENLDLKGFLASSATMEFENNLENKSINANIYKNGKLIALYPQITPGDKASFAFKSNIWIGVADTAEEGKELTSEVISGVNTEIELNGMRSADIVMTSGSSSISPYSFHLENVIMQ